MISARAEMVSLQPFFFEVVPSQSDNWLHTILEASFNKVLVMRQSLLVDGAPTEWHDSRPRNGERIRRYAQGCNASDI